MALILSKRKILILVSLLVLISFLAFGFLVFKPQKKAISATFTWTQNDWSGGADTVATNSHINEQSNPGSWNKYYSSNFVSFALDNKPQAIPDPAGLVILWDQSSNPPSGWTEITSNYSGRLLRINSTPGGIGGRSVHSHSVVVNSTVCAYKSISTGGQSIVAPFNHTHSVGTISVSNANLIPLSVNLRLFQYSGSVENFYIPSDAILLRKISNVPSYGLEYVDFNNYFLRLNSNPRTTYGSNSHVHSMSGFTGTVSNSPVQADDPFFGTPVEALEVNHTHPVTGSSSSASNIPLYSSYPSIKLTQDIKRAGNNNLYLFISNPNALHWNLVTSENQRYLRFTSISSCSTPPCRGGNASHSHTKTTGDNTLSLTYGSYSTSSSANGCAGKRGTLYVFHTHTLTLNSTSNNPLYVDVALASPSTYQGEVVSSPFDTEDPTTILSGISWNEELGSLGNIKFQIRSSSDGVNWSPWMGPDGTSNTYFDDGIVGCSKSGNSVTCTIDALPQALKDGSGERYFQYKVILENDAKLLSVSINYTINTEPTISNVSASQSASNPINVSYDYSDVENDSANIYLFYDTGLTLASNITSSDTTISVSDPNSVLPLIPNQASYTLMIDKEIITCTNKDPTTNTFSSCTRASNNTGFYLSSHSAGTTVWIKANSLSGDAGSNILPGAGKSITWDVKQDIPGLYLPSTATNPFRVRVVAEDGNQARNVGYLDSPPFELDTKDPVVGTPSGGGTGVNINQNQLTVVTNQDKTNTPSVTLYLSATDDTALQMIVSEDGVFDTETYQGYSSTLSYTFSPCSPSTPETGCTKTIYVKFKDAKGNEVGPYTDTIILDDNPPEVPTQLYIQDISLTDCPTNPQSCRLFISWSKNTEADWIRYEIYRSTDGTNFTLHHTISLENNAQARDTNYFVDSGLTYGQKYWYKVRSVDDIINNSNFSTPVSLIAGGNPTDTAPPTITSGPQASNIGISSATITWTTDEVSTSEVIYSTDPTVPQGSPTQGVSGFDTNHSVTLVGLQANTTYYFKVKSCDASGNCAESSISQFATQAPDTTPPVISNIQVSNITESSATITWTTDKNSDSFVEYSTTPGFTQGEVQGKFELVTSHSVTLVGLQPNTTYYFKVRSTDASGNTATSLEQSFTTLASTQDVTPPQISNVQVSNIQYNTATITWTTDEPSSSFVEFGLDTNYGRIYGQDESVTLHTVNLPKDLSPSTLYHFRVRSVDSAGNEAISQDYTFTTAPSPNDTTPPVISNVQVTNVTETSATITWTTDEDSDSYVDFDTTLSFSQSQGSPTMTTTHSVTLVGLQPNTLYYFRVRSTDPSGNTAIDDNAGQGYQFVTLTSTQDPPVIDENSITITNVTHNSATITWTTDKPSDSFVEFGFDTSYGFSQGKFESVTQHSVTLVGLLSEATYRFRVRSKDAQGLEDVSQDYTFTTAPAPDITPPTISNVQVSNITQTSAEITWTTDEPTTSIVDYGLACNNLTQLAGDPQNYVASHSVSLNNLQPGTTYYFRIRSTDQSGNTATDDNAGSCYTFTTQADITPPTITNVQTPVVDRNSATVTWDTDEPATSQVEYSPSSDLTNSTLTPEITDLRTKHSVVVPGLTSGTTYYYRVISKDSSGNIAYYPTSPPYPSFTTASSKEDNTPPTITFNPQTDITTTLTSATITWTTNEPANSLIDYGETTSLGSLAGNPDISSPPFTVTITDLKPGTTYYFRLRSTDQSGNTTIDDNQGNLYTFQTQADTTPPTISNVKVASVGLDRATITWETSEPSVSQIFFGTSPGNYSNQTILTSTYQTLHSITLQNLQANTTYYFKVKSIDSAGNSVEKDKDNQGNYFSFQTLKKGGGGAKQPRVTIDTIPPKIRNVTVKLITQTSATITWETDEPSNSLVEYGVTREYGELEGNHQESTTFHVVVLTNLNPGTTYYFKVVSYDRFGNRGESFGSSFTTLPEGVTAPHEEKVKEILERKEKFERLKEKEKLGRDEVEEVKQEEAKTLLDQIVELIKQTGEKPEVVIETISRKLISPPQITGESPQVEVGPDYAIIRWVTDKPSTSVVALAEAKDYNPNSDNPYTFEVGNTREYVLYHEVRVEGLKPETTYHYQIISQGRVGPPAKSEDRTFTTLSLKPQIQGLRLEEVGERSVVVAWETQIPTTGRIIITNPKTGEKKIVEEKNLAKKHKREIRDLLPTTSYNLQIEAIDEKGNRVLSQVLPFSTSISAEPPKISNLKISTSLIPGKPERVQTIISWQTDKPSTSRVYFQEGIQPFDPNLQQSTPLQEKLVLDHVVIILTMKPGTLYRIKAESIDAFGNVAYSKDYTILTPKPKASLIQLIIENLEESFQFLKKVGI